MVSVFNRMFAIVYAFFFLVLQSAGITGDFGGVHKAAGWFSYDFAYSTEKVLPDAVLGRDASFDIHLAKNEREACQFTVRARYGEDDASVTLSEFVNENGDVLAAKIYKEATVPWGNNSVQKADIPDALVPYGGETFHTSYHVNTTFYIEVLSDENTAPGTYTASIKINARKDEQSLEAKITATVWNFTLPDDPGMDTAMGIFGSSFFTLNGLPASIYGHNGYSSFQTLTDEQRAVYKQYYDLLLEHGISAYVLPYDIMSSEAEEYMDNPRVTSFCIPYSYDDETLVAYYNRVCEKDEWAKKAYFYPIDEPRTTEHAAQYKKITDRLTMLCPGYNMVTPFYSLEIKDDETGDIVKNFEMQCGRSSILCPETICYDENDNLYNLMQERTTNGDKAWWYVCCGPTGDYCNMFIHLDGLKHRVLFWQQRQYDVTGLLYWDVAYWDKCGNPWYNSKTWESYSASGDGSWTYPGKTIGLNEPVASLRLKGAGNGIEDYSYFMLAQELLGEEYVENTIAKVTKSLTKYTNSDSYFEEVRVTLGEAIASAQ